MKIRSLELETVCGITSTLPENDKPEIAFAGKSNVGKSSLKNHLQEHHLSQEKHRQLISIILMILCTALICLVMDLLRFPEKHRQSGER